MSIYLYMYGRTQHILLCMYASKYIYDMIYVPEVRTLNLLVVYQNANSLHLG